MLYSLGNHKDRIKLTPIMDASFRKPAKLDKIKRFLSPQDVTIVRTGRFSSQQVDYQDIGMIIVLLCDCLLLYLVIFLPTLNFIRIFTICSTFKKLRG